MIEPGDGRARLARRARASAACPSRPSCCAASRGRRCPARPPGRWDGLRVLVTAGGTREPIDPVRFIGNRSSGRMGFALAARRRAPRRRGDAGRRQRRAAARRRASRRSTSRPPRSSSRGRASEFADADVLLMAAAPADFRPAEPPTARSRSAAATASSCALEPTEDILAGARRPRAPWPDAGRLRRRARRRRGRARAREARAQGRSTRSSSTTSRDPRSASTRDDNEVTIVERGRRARRSPLASKDARSPRRSSTGSRRSARSARAAAGREPARAAA